MSNSNDFRFELKQTMKGSWEYTEGGGIMYHSTNDRFVVLKTPTHSNYTSADIINMGAPVNMFNTPLIVPSGQKFIVFHEAWALFHDKCAPIVEVFRKRFCEKYTDTILVNTYQIDGIHYLCVIKECIIKHLISLMTEQLNINTEIDTLYMGVSHEGDKIHSLCTSGNIRHHFKINKELLKYRSDLVSFKSLSIKKITIAGHSMYGSLEFEGNKAAYLELTRQKSNLIDNVLGGHTEFTPSDLDIIEELIQEFDRFIKEKGVKCQISNKKDSTSLEEIVEKLQGIINIECGKSLWSYREVRKMFCFWRSNTVDKKASLKGIQTAVLAYAKEVVDCRPDSVSRV